MQRRRVNYNQTKRSFMFKKKKKTSKANHQARGREGTHTHHKIYVQVKLQADLSLITIM